MSRIKLETVYKETYNEVPAGGTTGQVLKKASNTNYDADWQTVPGVGSNFVDLGDTPSSYSGSGAKYVVVNGAEDALEFTTVIGTVEEFTDLTDTPANYTGSAGKYAKVNVGETALEFSSVSGGGGLEQTYTTGENISDGDFIKIKENKAYKRHKVFDGYSFTGAVDFIATDAVDVEIMPIDDTTFFLIFIDQDNISGFGVLSLVYTICTINDTTKAITVGSYAELVSSSVIQFTIIELNSTDNLLYYSLPTISAVGLLKVSGSTLVLTEVTGAVDKYTNLSIARVTDSIFIIAGEQDDSSNNLTFQVGNVTGSTLTLGGTTIKTLAGTQDSTFITSIVRMTDTIVIITYLDKLTGIYSIPVTIASSTSGTFGTARTIVASIDSNDYLQGAVSFSENVFCIMRTNIGTNIDNVEMMYYDALGGGLINARITNIATNQYLDGTTGYRAKSHISYKISDNTVAIMSSSYNHYNDSLSLLTYNPSLRVPVVFENISIQLGDSVKRGKELYGLVKAGDNFICIYPSNFEDKTYSQVFSMNAYEPIFDGTKYGYASTSVTSGNPISVNILGVD